MTSYGSGGTVTHPKRHADPGEGLDLSEYGLDAEKAVHLWATGVWPGEQYSPISRCGSTQENHSCSTRGYQGESHCLVCGLPYCAYCRLLDPQWR